MKNGQRFEGEHRKDEDLGRAIRVFPRGEKITIQALDKTKIALSTEVFVMPLSH